MKVININYPITNDRHKPKQHRSGMCTSAGQSVSKSEKLNRGYNTGGSFTGKEKAAASLSSRLFEGLIDACNNHTTIVQNLVALGLALGPRTIAILSLPGKKNKEDKIYASGHAWASGLIGFGFSTIVMYPLGEAAKKVRQDAQKVLSRIDTSNDVKLVTRRLTRLSADEASNQSLLRPEKLLEGTSFWDTDPEKYIKKYGVPYDKEFLEQFGTLDETTQVLKLKKGVDYKQFHIDYNATHLTKEKLLEGTKHIKDRFADRFLRNFVELGEKGEFIKINKKVNFDLVYKAVNMAPDVFVFGVAKAMLTIALIPPILKYVFGLEKGKSASKEPPAPTSPKLKDNPILNHPCKAEGGVK